MEKMFNRLGGKAFEKLQLLTAYRGSITNSSGAYSVLTI
jgi:hypothetical protein